MKNFPKIVLRQITALALLLFITLGSPIAPAAETATNFTYKDALPGWQNAFVALSGTTAWPGMVLGRSDFAAVTWGSLGAGSSVRIDVLQPPGTLVSTVFTESPNMTAWFGYCEDAPNSCSTSLGKASAAIFPANYIPGVSPPAQVLTTPRIASIVIWAKEMSFVINSMSVSWTISDVGKYEAWRKARSWAGGSGDCDGMGNVFIGCGSSPPPVCTPPKIFQNGQCIDPVTSCTAPLVLQNGQCVTPVTNCTAPQVLQNGLCVTPSPAAGSAVTVAQGASVPLSEPSGKTLSNCQSFTPAMVSVSSSGATLTVNVALTAAIGSEVAISCKTSATDYWYNTIVVAKAPSLTAFAYDENALTMTATVDGAATGYWVALVNSATLAAPTAAQVRTNVQSPHGSGAMTSGSPLTFKLTGLSPNTSYRVFFFAEFAANFGNSVVREAFFHTPSTPRTPESITAISYGPSDKLTLSANLKPASDDTGLGNVYVLAALPPPGHSFFMTTDACDPGQSNCWKPWTGGEFVPYSKNTNLTSAGQTIPIVANLDVSSINGTAIYAAYRKANGYAFDKIYTLAPRPTLGAPALDNNTLTTTGARVAATASSNVVAYWVAVPYTTTPPAQPSDANIKKGLSATGASVASNYNNPPAASQLLIADMAGLLPAMRYKLFMYGDDPTGNNTQVQSVEFRTRGPAVAEISAKDDTSTATNLKLTVTIVPAEKDVAVEGDYFVYAVLPAATPQASDYFYLTERGCSPAGKCWVNLTSSNAAPIPYAAAAEPLLNKTLAVDIPVDARLKGAKIMASYRQGQDAAAVLSNGKQVH